MTSRPTLMTQMAFLILAEKVIHNSRWRWCVTHRWTVLLFSAPFLTASELLLILKASSRRSSRNISLLEVMKETIHEFVDVFGVFSFLFSYVNVWRTYLRSNLIWRIKSYKHKALLSFSATTKNSHMYLGLLAGQRVFTIYSYMCLENALQ